MHNTLQEESWLTIRESIERFGRELGAERSAHTCQTYLQYLHGFEQTLAERNIDTRLVPVGAITREWVRWYVQDLQYVRLASRSTLRVAYAALNRYFKWTRSRGWLDMDPLQEQDWPRSRRRAMAQQANPMSESAVVGAFCELAAQFTPRDAQETGLAHLRDMALILAIADAGAAAQEICDLVVEDYDRRRSVLRLPNLPEGIPCTQRLNAALDAYLAALAWQRPTEPGQPLFIRLDRRAGHKFLRLTPKSVHWIVREWAKRFLRTEEAALITPRTLRQAFITRLLKKTGHVQTAQHFARHRSLQSTLRYLGGGLPLTAEAIQSLLEPEIGEPQASIFTKKG